jgi:hypothetical protein
MRLHITLALARKIAREEILQIQEQEKLIKVFLLLCEENQNLHQTDRKVVSITLLICNPKNTRKTLKPIRVVPKK